MLIPTPLSIAITRAVTSAPAEWLRLTIDPHAPRMFSWENVVYCNNPAVSCP